jgi:cytochrome c biogenesis protein CcmG/thiol:disulfide interchange protein DsbE
MQLVRGSVCRRAGGQIVNIQCAVRARRRSPVRSISRMRRLLIVVAATIASHAWAGASPLNLAEYRGKVIYLDFWASWCSPCRDSFPWMSQLQARLEPLGLIVIAVNVDRVRVEADRFLRNLPPGFQVVYDPEGFLPKQFGVKGMPTSFVIDRKGVVRLRHEGFRRADEAALADQVQSLVSGN